MNKEEKIIIIPFNKTLLLDNYVDMYRILRENKDNDNPLLRTINQLLRAIDLNDIRINTTIEKTLYRIMEIIGCNSVQNKFVVKFILDEGFIIMERDVLRLTPLGRVFLISDSVSSSVDIFKYFWQELNWKRLIKSESYNNIFEKDIRNYIACLLSQYDKIMSLKDICSFNNSKLKHSLYGCYDNLFDIISDKHFVELSEGILLPLGIATIDVMDGEKIVKITEMGMKIFNNYSLNFKEDYMGLLKDCWENFDRGNYENAYEIAKSLLNMFYGLPEVYNIIGCTYILMKEYETAKEIFKNAIELCDENLMEYINLDNFMVDIYVPLHYNIGLCYYYLYDYINALKVFNNIRKTVPNRIEKVEELFRTIKKLIISGT